MDLDTMDEAAAPMDRTAGRERWMRQRLARETERRRFRFLFRPHRIAGHVLDLAGIAFRPRFMAPLTRHAYNPELTGIELSFPDLPRAFDGYRVLHLSDFHFDRVPGIEHAVAKLTRGLTVDLAVLTGDFQDARSRSKAHLDRAILRPLRTVCGNIAARDGMFAVLGNHDSAGMVTPFESMGLRVLVNETVRILRQGQFIHVTGLDDVCRYYTPAAHAALREGYSGFKIALVHSADLYDEASVNGYSLQLSGHTHGGQICLPGGVPIFTNLRAGRRFASGLWQHGSLLGITNRGVGATGVPLRAFCRGEVLVITLRQRT